MPNCHALHNNKRQAVYICLELEYPQLGKMLLRASSRRLLPACYISPEHSLFRVCSDGRSSGASTSYSLSATNSTGSRQASTSSKVGASEALLNAVKDKDLVKTLGYINGEFVPASDDTTFDVSHSLRSCGLLVLKLCPMSE